MWYSHFIHPIPYNLHVHVHVHVHAHIHIIHLHVHWHRDRCTFVQVHVHICKCSSTIVDIPVYTHVHHTCNRSATISSEKRWGARGEGAKLELWVVDVDHWCRFYEMMGLPRVHSQFLFIGFRFQASQFNGSECWRFSPHLNSTTSLLLEVLSHQVPSSGVLIRASQSCINSQLNAGL